MSYHVCVGGHYLRVGRKRRREKKQDTNKATPEIMQKPRELSVYRKLHHELHIAKETELKLRT